MPGTDLSVPIRFTQPPPAMLRAALLLAAFHKQGTQHGHAGEQSYSQTAAKERVAPNWRHWLLWTTALVRHCFSYPFELETQRQIFLSSWKDHEVSFSH